MRVFVDESGDTGLKFDRGSSLFFTLAAVVFRTEVEYLRCEAAIEEFRKKLGWRKDREFKFNKMNAEQREEFLQRVAGQAFTTHVFVLNKKALWPGALPRKDQMYLRVARWLIQNAMNDLSGATVVFDKCGEREFYTLLRREIILASAERPKAISKVIQRESHDEPCLQLADVICGAAARMQSPKQDARSYYPIVAHRQGTFRRWPQ